ncbi:MAG: hypothetical protein VB141_13515 [Burkholderia gladioli]
MTNELNSSMSEVLAKVYATIIGDDTPKPDAGINAIDRVQRAAQVLRLEVELYRAQANGDRSASSADVSDLHKRV